jgi:pilus assembly protein CpaF
MRKRKRKVNYPDCWRLDVSFFDALPDRNMGMASRFAAFHKTGSDFDIFSEDEPRQNGDAPESAERATESSGLAPPPAHVPVPQPNANSREKLLDAKAVLHRRLIEEFNLVALEKLPRDELVREIRNFVSDYVSKVRLALNTAELEDFVGMIVDEMTGLGPLEPLMRNPDISDILINGHANCYAEIRGMLQPVNIPFKDEAHLMRIINKIVAAVGRRIDESNPMCDARMADGSRFNAAIRPIAIDGPLVSIRKFSKNKLSLEKLVEYQALPPQMATVLRHAVHARKTTIISGGTGTGKTTMLNALSANISARERVITIEDAAELALQIPHVGRMETRPPNNEGIGEIRQRDLVKNALRMRPDRVILGECRGEEAFDMLQAMNTGHEGSMATIHANTPRDAIARLEQMLGMTGMPMTVQSIRSQIANAIHLIVQLTRLSDGQRKVTSVTEVTGMEGEVVQMQEIFRFRRTGAGPGAEVEGHFEATGVRPRFLEDLVAAGIRLSGDIFEPGVKLK